MQQRQHRRNQDAPANDQAHPAIAATLTDERPTCSHQHHGKRVTTKPEQRTERTGKPTANDASGFEIDGKTKQHTNGDHRDGNELVFATLDRLAQFGPSAAATRC